MGAFPFAQLQRSWAIAPRLPLSELKVAGFTPLQIQLLYNRGIDESRRASFWNADWHATKPWLVDLDKAVTRIQAAIAGDERIVVFGDYDCDGITSCALLTRVLQILGAQVAPFIPTREDDGRGLNGEAIRLLAEQRNTLLITTDCGTANVAEAELASSLGMHVIVTDHHPLHGTPAQVLALLNPQRPDDFSTNKDLSGVGVAFRLAEALAEGTGNSRLAQELPGLLDLVAIGTIADVVPLSAENWALAHTGLAMLNRATRPGIVALAERSSLVTGRISERDVSFSIAPRLNAAGRLGRPQVALELLLTHDLQEARRLAAELDELNSERQRMTEDVLRSAQEQIARLADNALPPALVVQGSDWPLGVLGLVAGRLADQHGRPTFVISSSGTESRGSVRGQSGMNLGQVLADWPGEFKRFGGHRLAAGFTIANGDLENFITYIQQTFTSNAQMKSAADVPSGWLEGDVEHTPIAVDCQFPLSSITEDRYRALRRLAPFGAQFPEPVFLSTDLKILRCWQSGPDGRNLRLVLSDKFSKVNFLWSRQGGLCDSVQASLTELQPVNVVYTLDGYRRRDGSLEIMPRILTIGPVDS
ncbi:MAG: single-stranded-DNA-specific exonuclease RecJ [Ktedonobacterales bacterium]